MLLDLGFSECVDCRLAAVEQEFSYNKVALLVLRGLTTLFPDNKIQHRQSRMRYTTNVCLNTVLNRTQSVFCHTVLSFTKGSQCLCNETR